MALNTTTEHSTPMQDGVSRLPISSQEKEIEALHENISIIEKRLNAVLAPRHEADTSSPDSPTTQEPSPLALQLMVNNYGIFRASNRMVDRTA